jgi:hypothetical protein
VAPTRTAKSCGPDAPTLASSLQVVTCRRRWQKSPVAGESTKETVKTIAQGRPGVPGGPVVTTLVCFQHFAREAMGAAGTRLSLHPLLSRVVRTTARALFAQREGELMPFQPFEELNPAMIIKADGAYAHTRSALDLSDGLPLRGPTKHREQTRSWDHLRASRSST